MVNTGTPQGNARKLLTAAWAKLAASPEAFQYPTSRADTLQGIFDDLGVGFLVTARRPRSDLERHHNVVHEWLVRTDDERIAHVYRNRDGDIWVDASALKSGESHGSALYAGLLNYAYNTQGRLVGDPAGVSDMAIFRRTENMLASALKFGTTQHMVPAREQMRPGLFIDTEGHSSGVTEKFRPLAWSDNDQENLANMLEVSHAHVSTFVPEVQNACVDFATGKFYWEESLHPVTEGDFERMARTLARALRGDSTAQGTHSATENVMSATAHTGYSQTSATIQRTILTNTLLRASRHADGGFSELAAIGGEARPHTDAPKHETAPTASKTAGGEIFIDLLREEILHGAPVRFSGRKEVPPHEWEARTPQEKIWKRLHVLAVLQEAQRFKARASHIPFYAQRAARTGDDRIWLQLAASYAGAWQGREKDLLKQVATFPEYAMLKNGSRSL